MTSLALTGLLAALGFVAATVSAITGVGGGVLLLSGLLLLVPATAVVPLHGAVQFVAGSSRVALFADHIRWDLARPFLATLLPGSLLGAGLAFWIAGIEPSVLKLMIATAILLSLIPRADAAGRPAWQERSGSIMAATGFACGLLGMLVGSTGPIVSQTLLMLGVTGEEHVGTKSAVQAVAHVLKVPIFGLALAFDYGAYLIPLAAMSVAALAGTWLGKRALSYLSQRRFVGIARGLLAVVALKIIATTLI